MLAQFSLSSSLYFVLSPQVACVTGQPLLRLKAVTYGRGSGMNATHIYDLIGVIEYQAFKLQSCIVNKVISVQAILQTPSESGLVK
jgi:hypothetical protein